MSAPSGAGVPAPAQEAGYVSAEDEDFAPDVKAAEEDAADRAALASVVDEDDVKKAAMLAAVRRPVAAGRSGSPGRRIGRSGKAVDEIFEDMKRADEALVQSKKRARSSDGKLWKSLRKGHREGHFVAVPMSASTKKKKPAKPTTKRKKKAALPPLKGQARVASMLAKSTLDPFTGAPAPGAQPPSTMPPPTKRPRAMPSAEAVEAVRLARQRVASTKVAVTETVKFAGQATTVTKYVNSVAEAAAPRADLADVVADLGKQKNISTVEKSSRDWDKFKVEEGIDDDLELKTKDGYLEKQDFLSRVDHRQFEKEKEARILERSAREKK